MILPIFRPDPPFINRQDVTLRQCHILPEKRFEISRSGRDATTSDFKVRDEHFAETRVVI